MIVAITEWTAKEQRTLPEDSEFSQHEVVLENKTYESCSRHMWSQGNLDGYKKDL